ncbi:dnaj homolog subfamily a member mitochondrial-like [Phaffia rhodozyma]|uniref:Dnaj homolog subfamily a member mitochondrial-like n=1 Tax=Phaffia rhodozyma TaxID=264483 RepID=A0A0F7SFT7_PHARH|nr:dnaj homolog subfamily a member mitochondrial-like [Phaffia rhodozyma]
MNRSSIRIYGQSARGVSAPIHLPSLYRRSFHSSPRSFSRSPPPKTLYQVLGLERSADKKVIKEKFYELSKKYHPDLRPNDESAKQTYLDISSAYDVLGNESKRKQYDLTLSPVPTYQNPQTSSSHYPSSSRNGRPSSWVHPSTRTAPRPRSSTASNPSAHWPLNHRRPRQPFSPPPGNTSHFGPYVNPNSYSSPFDRYGFDDSSRPMYRTRSAPGEGYREGHDGKKIINEKDLSGLTRAFGVGLMVSIAFGIGAGFSGAARSDNGSRK